MFDHKLDIDPAAVIEAAAESILVTTADLDSPGPSIVFANPAFERMTGWSRDEVIGKSPKILQGPKTNYEIFADLRDKLQSGLTWEGRTLNYRKDGTEFWMEWSIVPVADKAGRIYQYVAIQRDVSDRIAAEKRLEAAQDARRLAERAQANLARYFPAKLVDTLAKKDKPLGAIRRQNLAVLFADIVGFTKLSEQLEPEKVMELLRDVHVWMEKTIFKYDGSIEGFVGDAVVAIFGFPKTSNRDGDNALHCAIELLTEAQTWNRERADRAVSPINIGVGLHFGPAVLGDVGTEAFVEFTVIGDTVNVASRLQQFTRSLQSPLVVSDELINAVLRGSQVEKAKGLLARFEPRGEMPIRGREKTVEVWTLIQSK